MSFFSVVPYIALASFLGKKTSVHTNIPHSRPEMSSRLEIACTFMWEKMLVKSFFFLRNITDTATYSTLIACSMFDKLVPIILLRAPLLLSVSIIEEALDLDEPSNIPFPF